MNNGKHNNNKQTFIYANLLLFSFVNNKWNIWDLQTIQSYSFAPDYPDAMAIELLFTSYFYLD